MADELWVSPAGGEGAAEVDGFGYVRRDGGR
jgi:hypothetical protein